MIELTNYIKRHFWQGVMLNISLVLRPYIYSEVNHKQNFIKIPFINKGMEFIDYIVSLRMIQ